MLRLGKPELKNPGDMRMRFEEAVNTIPPGRYRHFKGGEYEFICIAKNSETMEDLVIYRELFGEHKVWARPASMFYQFVEVNGKLVPRFEKIG